MRVSNWNPRRYEYEHVNVSMNRLRKAANLVADRARAKVPVGTISRPIYRRGKYAGQPWTARDAGSLKRSIRVVEKYEEFVTTFGEFGSKNRNVRVYAGTYLAYYAAIVEYSVKRFMRPALNGAKRQIKDILENG